MSTMRRWLLRWFAIVDVQLPEDYLRAHGHDAVVRALWSDVGARVTLNGRRPVLETPRHISDLSWQEWGRILVAIALPAVHFIQCALFERPLNPRVVLLLAVLGIGLAYTLLSSALRFGPDDPLSRETLATASRPRSTLRRYKALGPNDDPAAYAGSRAYLLGMCGVLPMVALTIVFLGAIRVGFVATRLSQDPKPSAVVLFAWIASMAVGTVLSHYLTSMRLSVGERGLTLQPEGLLGPRLFIPFANIRSVVATQGIWRVGAKLWLVFRDGSDVRYGPMLSVIPFASPARVLRAVEEAIQQRLPARAKHAAVVPAATNT